MKLGEHNVPYLHPSTPPATDAYRDGWEAIFGKPAPDAEPAPDDGIKQVPPGWLPDGAR